MFLHMSVIHSVHGWVSASGPGGCLPPPLGRHPPWVDTPSPCPVHAGIHTPFPVHAGIHTTMPSA